MNRPDCQNCDHYCAGECGRPILREHLQTWPLLRTCKQERVWWGKWFGRCGREGRFYWDANLEFQEKLRMELADPIFRQQISMAIHDLFQSVLADGEEEASERLNREGMM